MSSDVFDEFFRTGLLRLPAALTPDVVHVMRERLWRFLAERRGIQIEDRSTWPVGGVSGFQSLSRAGAFTELACPALTTVCDRILGAERWGWPKTSAMPLVTFPQSDEWRLPHAAWHLDFAPRPPSDALPGLRIFAFLSPTAAQGGGTVVLAGSHRLLERCMAGIDGMDDASPIMHSDQLRRRLAQRHPWLRDLWSPQGSAQERTARFLNVAQVVDQVDLRVVELTSDAGDLVVMHPGLLHAAAPNCSALPRMMLSWSITPLSFRG